MDISFLPGVDIEVTTLAQAVELFTRDGMPARNLAAHTRKNYLLDLTDLLQFLTKRGVTRIADVSLRHFEAYQAEMDRRGYASSTRNRKTQSLRILFQFLHLHGITETNLAEKLIPPSVQKTEPRFLTESEYRRLLRVCSHHARDAAMIEVFLQTGMRLSELAKLTVSDIDIPKRITTDPDNTGTVRVRRKGGNIEYLPLNHKACKALANYLQVRIDAGYPALFLTKFRQPMSNRAIQKRVEKYCKEADIENASVHTLRHTTGTHHVAQGTDLRTVQALLGHASIATTALYIHTAKTVMKKAVQEHAL